MAVSNETLRAMVREFHGFEVSDEELEGLRPEVDNYLAEVEKLRELDLSNVMSARLIHAQDGGSPDA